MYKNALIVVRMQPIHNGHIELIKMAEKLSKRVEIMLGSAQERGTERNPFSLYLRERMLIDVIDSLGFDRRRFKLTALDDMTTHEDNSYDWGRYILKNAYVRPDIFLYGNDDCRSTWFHKDDIVDISEFIMSRKTGYNFSATDVRLAIKEDNFESFCSMTHSSTHKYYYELKRILNNEIKYNINKLR